MVFAIVAQRIKEITCCSWPERFHLEKEEKTKHTQLEYARSSVSSLQRQDVIASLVKMELQVMSGKYAQYSSDEW